jgi:hypothetical protein
VYIYLNEERVRKKYSSLTHTHTHTHPHTHTPPHTAEFIMAKKETERRNNILSRKFNLQEVLEMDADGDGGVDKGK